MMQINQITFTDLDPDTKFFNGIVTDRQEIRSDPVALLLVPGYHERPSYVTVYNFTSTFISELSGKSGEQIDGPV
jgi:hypothetical protein